MSEKIILIVEDEGIVAKALQQKLIKYGYACKTICNSGIKAVEAAKKENPDLILMDIHLKGEMDGIETAEIINENMDTPIIYLTAYANEETLDRAKNTEPYAYILKPYKDKDLEVTIQIALNKHKFEKKHKKNEKENREELLIIKNIVKGELLNRLCQIQKLINLFFNNKDNKILENASQELDESIEIINKIEK